MTAVCGMCLHTKAQFAYRPMNTKPEDVRLEGEVIDALPSAMFKVRLEGGREILAYLAGKMRMHRIKILVGDRVVVECTPYDQNRGRIVYRK